MVERAMAFAIDEPDDDLAVARLAWLAQDDQAVLAEAGEVCLERAEADPVVCGRAGRAAGPGRPQRSWRRVSWQFRCWSGPTAGYCSCCR
jgi:hypothetical protein